MQPGIGSDLFEIYKTYKTSKADAEQKNRMLEIGGLAGSGDYQGAAAKALGYGDLQTGNSLLQLAQGQKKFDTEDRQQVAGALSAADTPQKWAATIAYLKQSGHKVTPEEENFTNRDAILGQAIGADGQLRQKNADRSFNAEQDYHNQSLGIDRQRLDISQQELALKKKESDQNGGMGDPPANYIWGPKTANGEPTLKPIQGGSAAPLDFNDPSTKSYIELIANNKGKPPSAGRNPQVRADIIKAVLQVNPKWDETKFEARQKQADSFAAGPLGSTARSLGVGVAHLDVLQGLGDALQNGDVQMINAAKQEWSRQFGGEAPVDFEAAKSIVADEIAKGVIGGQNAQSDREALAASVRSSSSPQQLKGVITTFQQLMGGQLGGLRQQYQSVNPGANDFDERFLTPETARILEQFSGAGGSNDPALEDALSKYQ